MKAILIPTGNSGKLREFAHSFSTVGTTCLGIKDAESMLGSEFRWTTPIEDRQTFVGNGCRKLFAAIELLTKLRPHGVTSALVDDSGLCVPRLNYSPGVHSANLAGEPRDDARNRKFLIDLLKNRLGLDADQRELAFFVCSLLVARPVSDVRRGERPEPKNMQDALQMFENREPEIMERVRARLQYTESAAYAYCDYISDGNAIYQVDCVMGFCTGFVATEEQELLSGEGHGYDALFFPRANPELSFASIPLSKKNLLSHRSEALRGLIEWEKSRNARGEIRELF